MLPTEKYNLQAQRWPLTGRHILASFDDETIVVYQSYSPAIGHFATSNGYFGGEFRYSRMSWIKPNFLWMMYRSNWGQSPGQEVVLAIRLRRTFFDSILAQAVPSSYSPMVFLIHDEWKTAVEQSDVRLQWDPDHLPDGGHAERRAIQLGLRGSTLEAYGKREIIEIVNISEFVAAQRANAVRARWDDLHIALERIYFPKDEIAEKLGLDG